MKDPRDLKDLTIHDRTVDIRLQKKRNSELPLRQAGPLDHTGDKVDLDQQAVNKELSFSCSPRATLINTHPSATKLTNVYRRPSMSIEKSGLAAHDYVKTSCFLQRSRQHAKVDEFVP